MMHFSIEDGAWAYTIPRAPGPASDVLADFEKSVDSGTWRNWRPEQCREAVVRLDGALRFLLAEARDWLDARGELDRPLARLAWLAPRLERAANENSPQGDNARLCLGMLPFPGCLRRLARLERDAPDHPLVLRVQAGERAKLEGKVRAKGAGRYKAHNLCQVLKACKGRSEKGVIRMHTLVYALPAPLLAELSTRYVFFLEPPMGTVFRHQWLRRFATLGDPVLVGAPGAEDMDWLAAQPGLVPLPLAHGHFLADKPAVPDAPARYDIVFNSAFNDMPRKRHGLMLDLLKTPELAGTKALFLGYGGPKDVKKCEAMIARAGLADRVVAKANLPRREVPLELAACRMGVHLSRVENSPRAVQEFLRQGLPCVVSRLTSGMDFSMFNNETGAVVPDADLARTIRRVLDAVDSFSPAEWFRRNAGSANSSRRLNGYLKNHFNKCGYAWTEDACAITGSGAHRYADPAMLERFAPDYAWIRDRLRGSSLPFAVR